MTTPSHRHQWHVLDELLLSPPDDAGFAERFVSWRCTICGIEETMTGEMQTGLPLSSPEFWQQHSSTPTRRLRTQRRVWVVGSIGRST